MTALSNERTTPTLPPHARGRLPRPIAALIDATPDALLAGTFLLTWINPHWREPSPVRYLMLLMLLEFIIIHASAMMLGCAAVASRSRRTLTMFGFGLFYTLFVAGFALAFQTWWPLVSFWGLMLNRMLGSLLGWSEDGFSKQESQRTWGLSAVAYITCVFLTILLPVPRLGIVNTATLGLTGGGLWVSEPHRLLAFGALYYLAQVWIALARPR